MDPSSLIHESSFPASSASPSPFNLAEIWQFPIDNSGVGDSTGIIGVQRGTRRGDYGQPSGFGEASLPNNRDVSVAESTVTEQSGRSPERKRRDPASEDESSKHMSNSSGNEMHESKGKRVKVGGFRDDNEELKAEGETNSSIGNKPAEQSEKAPEPPKPDYIHVRARRGQATDSHSLAERARREKISERMKILQDLVPGCNKVIGKALVLDEIINYIQSLQRQVEFLSMKLEAVNSRFNQNIDGFPSKDHFFGISTNDKGAKPGEIGLLIPSSFGMQSFDTSGTAFGSQAAREYGQGSQPEWLHMQVGGGFERTT